MPKDVRITGDGNMHELGDVAASRVCSVNPNVVFSFL